jgi:hypothetical protein
MNKQETIEEAKLRAANYMSLKGVLEPKQETIEEAGVAYAKTVNENHTSHMLGFYNGAKWQQERMYSEEEVLDILYKHTEDLLAGKKIMLDDWFEQFKKK